MAAAMDCTCWTEDGCMTGADWRLRWELLEATLLFWWPGLVALDLVRTIAAFYRRKKLQNSKMKSSKFLPTDGTNWWTQWNQKPECPGCQWLESTSKSWKSKHKIRGDWGRLVKNPSMVKLVFLGFLFFMEVSEWLTLWWMNAYIAHFWAVTCLVTSPITEEFKRLRGNFHNCYGSYIIWACFP